jgi:hypothetical protein
MTGVPENAQTLGFGVSIDGVTTTTALDSGFVTVSGNIAADVLAVLDYLEVTLADDDENFVSGSVTGISGAAVDVCRCHERSRQPWKRIPPTL